MPPRRAEDPESRDPLPAEPPAGRPGPATVWWALLPILIPGAGAPIAFGIGTAHRPSPATIIPLIAYTAAVFGYCGPVVDYGSDMPPWADYLTMFSALAATFGASGHLFAIRRRLWTAPPAPVHVPAPQRPLPADGVPALAHALHLRIAARRIAEGDPMLAKRLRIGRPDLPRSNDDGGLVDLNHAPAAVLEELPGFNAALAERVRERVERLGPFQSLDEVILEIDIAPGFERHLREYAILLP
ncbi:helix-hairpin-helix domain-containing protein [Glycomyces sp. NPDC049804]|uniref:ComEA family DNA-binding protein n=1 Tax=Glycomyces sp. NPDC049804 TaxID=3154363 RepID=UPI003449A6BD